jgi:hypothetical protein
LKDREPYVAHIEAAESKEGETMVMRKERYVVDERGNRLAVLLDIADYNNGLKELEELDSIRAYDSAKASQGETIPLDRAISEIDRNR